MAKITKGSMNQRTARKKPRIDSMTIKPPKISIYSPFILEKSLVHEHTKFHEEIEFQTVKGIISHGRLQSTLTRQ